ncbi:MAG: NlpC/P60 family protein [Rhizobiaceae bacterium]|jgi:NlpC/P60 family putative phage cell wall peptidase|nr:NlpC/P60 family protein [Rhizobiaceae bacterium]
MIAFTETMEAARVIDAARDWIGTPYRHQGSRRGVGCDCLGLVRGVWRTLYGGEPEAVPPYTQDWAEARGGDLLLAAAMRHFEPRASDPQPGDVLLFRWSATSAAKHAGILVTPDAMIHAYSGVGVVESPVVPTWRRRIAGAFSFPARPFL